MSGRNLAITGIPRGGTTLACRLLGLSGQAVALFEPMDVMALPAASREQAVAAVEGFFGRAREQLSRDGTAPSKQRDGRVPDNLFDDATGPDGERPMQSTHGVLRVDPPPSPGFTLVVKHNAAFTALLPDLARRVESIAIVRNPLAVLASWNSVALPVRDGRLPAGERLDPALRARLEGEPSRLQRQLAILDWCFARFSTLPGARVLRYEDIIASQGALLFERAAVAGRVDAPLRDRNANPAWRDIDVDALVRALGQDGAWRPWYPAADVAALAERLRREQPR